MKNHIKFITNTIRKRANVLGPEYSPLSTEEMAHMMRTTPETLTPGGGITPAPPSVQQELPLSVQSPENIGHRYGMGDDNHKVMFQGEPLMRGTPDWEKFDSGVRSHFDNKIGADDFLKAYYNPKIHAQSLRIRQTGPGIPGIWGAGSPNAQEKLDVNYRGLPTEEDAMRDNPFLYTLQHKKEGGEHSVYWDSMDNYSKNQRVFPETLKQLFEAYPKMGVKHIDTHAMSGVSMNGAHTWGNLGFGWKDYDDKDRTISNLEAMLPGTEIPPGATEYPMDVMEFLKEQKAAGNLPKEVPVKNLYSKALSAYFFRPDDYSSRGGAFKGRLRLDPKDRGFQRANTLIRGLLRPRQNPQAS